MFKWGKMTPHASSGGRGKVRAIGWFLVAAVTVVGCGSSVGSGASNGLVGQAGGSIVVRFNGGFASDSYASFDASGKRKGSLGIPGYLFAGFSENLATAAVADQGTLGSGHAQTFLTVGPTAQAKKSRIFSLNDDLTTLPVWNPSGTLLAFGLSAIQYPDSTDVGGALQDGLWVISRNGQDLRLVAPGEIGGVAWNPDGSKLAFVSSDGSHATLKVVSASGGRPTELGSIQTEDGDQPIAWSPDGREVAIAYTVLLPGSSTWNKSGVDAYPASGGSPRPVFPGQSMVAYTGIAYAPNGSELALSTWTRPGLSPSESTSLTTMAGSAVATSSGYQLEVAQADGSSSRPIASLSSDGTLVGWFTG